MAVDVRIDGVLKPGAENFSVTEDATAIDPSDSSGGYGQISFQLPEDDDSVTHYDKPMEFTDASQGVTSGIVRTVSSTDGTVTYTADSRMSLLAAEKTAAPYIGTLGGALEYYLGLVGIITGFLTEDSITSLPVVFQGWTGEVGFELKQMAICHGAELTLVSDLIVLRPVRGRVAQNYRDITRTWTVDSSEVAEAVEVFYYPAAAGTDRLAYPDGGWNPDVQIYSVDFNETQVYDLPISASLSSVQQPVAMDYVSSVYEASSVYAVVGQDGLPYPAAQWVALGGSLTVELNPDQQSLTVTIVGPDDETNAPFGIKMSAGDSSFYSSLRIVGTGVFYEEKSVKILTGADPDRATQEIGATVKLRWIQSLEDALGLGIWAAARYAGPRHTLSARTNGINRRGDSGSYTNPTIDDFNAAMAGDLVNDFNTDWSGLTIDDFNAYWRAQTAGDFANQAFGNIGGARVAALDAWFHIRNGTVTESSVSYTAEADTTVDDFNDVWGSPPDDLITSFVMNPRYAVNGTGLALGSAGAGAVHTIGRNSGTGQGGSAGFGRIDVTTGSANAWAHDVQLLETEFKSGDEVFASIWVRSSVTRTARLRIQSFTDLAGTLGAATALDGIDVVLVANTWTRLVVAGTLPGTTTQSTKLRIRGEASTTGQTFDVDTVTYVHGTTDPGDINGGLSNGPTYDYAWLGTADGSHTQRGAHAALVSDFNTQWDGHPIHDFNVRPLRRTA